MTATYKTQSEVIVDRLDTIQSHLARTDTAIDSLMKALNQPASRAGMSPRDVIYHATEGGSKPAFFAPDGKQLPFDWGRNLPGCGMGPMLRMIAKRYNPQLDWISEDEANKTHQSYTKSLQDPSLPQYVKTALAEASGQAGGYTVPPMFLQQLQRLVPEDAVVLPRATHLPMTAATLQVPALDLTTVQAAGTSAFFGGIQMTWTAEAATRNESEPQFRQTELKAHEGSFYAVASNTLLADNAVGLDSVLTTLFGEAVPWYVDYACLQGNGVGKPMGIINAPATIQVTRAGGAASSTFAYSDATTMLGKLHVNLWRSRKAAWVMHQTVFTKLAQLQDGASRVVWIPLDAGAQRNLDQTAGLQSAGYLFGLPVIFSEKLPALSGTGDVLLADFSKYLIGDRLDIMVDISPHVKFLNNQMTWRITWRGDGQPWLNNPVTLADGAQTVSAFVALK